MATKYILARNLKEAHAFARDELGLERGHYRVVNSPSTIKAVFSAEVYLVPGWDQRYDRFAMMMALKWTKMTVIDVAKGEHETEQADPRGELTDEILDLAYAEHDVREGRGAPGMTSTGVTVHEDGSGSFQGPATTDPLTDVAAERDAVDPHVAPEPTGDPFPVDEPEAKDPEPEPEKPKNRRRSRCKDCGNLHYKGEPCPSEGDES